MVRTTRRPLDGGLGNGCHARCPSWAGALSGTANPSSFPPRPDADDESPRWSPAFVPPGSNSDHLHTDSTVGALHKKFNLAQVGHIITIKSANCQQQAKMTENTQHTRPRTNSR
jgi:hypothetical protein